MKFCLRDQSYATKTLAVWLAIFAFPSVAMAQISQAQRQQISTLLQDSADQFDAERLPDAEAAKSETLARATELVDFLESSTSEENVDAWLEYLKLDPLVEAISDDEKPTNIRREAISLRNRLVGLAPGLELSRMQALRKSIDRLIPAMLFADHDKMARLLPKKFQSDAKKLAEISSIPTVEEAEFASLALGVLRDTNQSTQVTDAIRDAFAYPNLAIWISEPVIQNLVSQPVNQTRRVHDCILGTTLTGTATMNGSVQANLIPTTGSIGLNIALTGYVVTQNRGYIKPISLDTTGYADVASSRSVFINESGVSMQPSQTSAVLRTKINSVNHRMRLVRRIAWKKACEQKPLADSIAQERLRKQVADSFDQQVNAAGNAPIPDFMQKARPFLKRLDFPEPNRSIGSTAQSVFMHTTIQRDDQLASPVPAPPISGFYEGAIQVHESAISNSFGYLFAGRTLNQTHLDELFTKLGVPAPKPEGDDAPKDFEIDFSRTRPIIFEARDGKLRVGISGTRFASDGKSRDAKLEVSAYYTPAKKSDGSAILVREGDVSVNILSRMSSIAKAGMRKPIKKRFDNVFPDTLLNKPFMVPHDAKAVKLRGRVYQARNLQADDGWLTVLYY